MFVIIIIWSLEYKVCLLKEFYIINNNWIKCLLNFKKGKVDLIKIRFFDWCNWWVFYI